MTHSLPRIVLVSIHAAPSAQSIPLAGAFLKGFAEDASWTIAVQDFFVQQPVATCVECLIAQEPCVVGFSLYVWNRNHCRDIARMLRQELPQIVLIAGGPEASADFQALLEEGLFDGIVVGEGEQPFREFCQRLATRASWSDIPGIATRTNTSPNLASASPLASLDAIPSPFLTGILETGPEQGILWQLARGCSFQCEFCFDGSGSRLVRRFSLERIEAELRHFATTGVTQVFVLDSTFNQDMERAKQILRLIRDIAPDIHFHFEIRSEFIDQEMAGLFATLSCSLQIGLQSADATVLQSVGRNFRRNDFTKRIDLLNRSGAVFGFDLMCGLPGDSLSTMCNSLDFALSLYPNHLDIFPLALLPGTSLTRRSGTLGLIHQKEPPYTLISSPTFPEKDLDQARQLALACDLFYTRGRAVAWFLSAIAPLKETASSFLTAFGTWLREQYPLITAETDCDDGTILQLQQEYLTVSYQRKKQVKLLPLALDLVFYHHYYAVALMTPLPTPCTGRLSPDNLLQTPWRLASSARLHTFAHDIQELLEAGMPDLRHLTTCLSSEPCPAVIYAHPEGVFTEALAEPAYVLLEHLDGTSPAGVIARKLGISSEECIEILDFASGEGIIIR